MPYISFEKWLLLALTTYAPPPPVQDSRNLLCFIHRESASGVNRFSYFLAVNVCQLPIILITPLAYLSLQYTFTSPRGKWTERYGEGANRSGPRQDPCGTPQLSFIVLSRLGFDIRWVDACLSYFNKNLLNLVEKLSALECFEISKFTPI